MGGGIALPRRQDGKAHVLEVLIAEFNARRFKQVRHTLEAHGHRRHRHAMILDGRERNFKYVC